MLPKTTNNITYNKVLTTSVARLQDLYIERVRDWSRFMAPAGWARLSRWHARDWMRLIWQALKSNTQGRASRLQAQRQRRMHYYTDDTFTLIATRHKHSMRQSARKKIGDILWSIYYETNHDDIRQLQVEFQDLSSPMLKWQWEGVTDNVGRLIHANHCLIQ